MVMKSVTLNGIGRVGLSAWKAREWWTRQAVSIWSHEHCAWWRRGGQGYTDRIDKAWVLPFADAYEETKHCGPEKRIVYYSRTPQDA